MSKAAIGTTETLRQSVVVFSKNYLPISRVNIRRAIVLLVTGKAEPLDFLFEVGWKVRSPSVILQVPAQIRLTMTSNERVWKIPPVNRREVLRRDCQTCQYCGSKKNLTLDHVIPRSQGGKHSWDNVVIACQRCNSKKGSRTPVEAGMPLKTKPIAPVHPAIAFAEQFWREQQINLE
ncbi:HNH endonuclease [Oscillatoria salina]|uniref:HNH endonuclease n=1 Tax=Oscillatoria salina TaxID=331517 RepID=UPI0013BB66D2|nr:HNH endonuclease [Oscillatoria salina]MBZ8183051.1 HNH endonuclease [Oscillatoria salina IIICB1]NET91232.1 HNH endonuclease [Kamptonema sp. SIO1D9]